MTQTISTSHSSSDSQGHAPRKAALGPLLCWAVVFADIGSSIYYTPGILYSTVGGLAGFFVLLTMVVFVLLTLKYAEVSQRFPEGGGVVSVAAQAINAWAGALGGTLILVSYFLTAAISCLSAIEYFGVIVPALVPSALWITVGVLILLGILNWIGISESAKVSMVGALIAFGSDLAILWTVFTHLSPAEVLSLFLSVFAHQALTPVSVLVGFAGAFLAFSGLESISQLSPVMKTPRKKVIGLALLLVVLTIGLTSPLLTTLSTLLQPQQAADAVLSTQLISLLGGHWGDVWLQTEVAISAGLILVFASNTAIIGAYHVFMALSRMDFFPSFILNRNRFRDTPHWSIAFATGIPIAVLLLVNGQINQLGDLYAFGLLGAFTFTCIGLDVLRSRERAAARRVQAPSAGKIRKNGYDALAGASFVPLLTHEGAAPSNGGGTGEVALPHTNGKYALQHRMVHSLGQDLNFWLGVLTTALVAGAWGISLIARPQAAIFGGSVALLGMGVASVNYLRRGRPPVAAAYFTGGMPGSVLAVLAPGEPLNMQVIEAAISEAHDSPVVFLYLGERQAERTPQPLEIVDPYLDDMAARAIFGKAERLARKARIARRFVYRQRENTDPAIVWQVLQPRDVVLSADMATRVQDINPDRIRYQLTSDGNVAHLLKRW
ncbi:MAG TPA: APC family permease [Ktedonobacteraceae bacterium]|nr:APC family permease [Ktedonobacteraceae bacterium]